MAIWGEVTPCMILTKCDLWADMVDIVTCAIFGSCQLRGVGVVSGEFCPLPLTTVWLCDGRQNSWQPFWFLTESELVNSWFRWFHHWWQHASSRWNLTCSYCRAIDNNYFRFGLPSWILIVGQYSCAVVWNTAIGCPFPVTCGVRQGGVLSPFLFAIYVDVLVSRSVTCLPAAYCMQMILFCYLAVGMAVTFMSEVKSEYRNLWYF